MGKKWKSVYTGILLITFIFLVSCSPVSGVSIPEGMEALLVGDVISQEVRIYDLTTHQIDGILQVRGYRYTGFELIDPDHLLFYSSIDKKLLLYNLVKGNVTKEILVASPVQDIIKVKQNHFLILENDGQKVLELILPEGSLLERITLPQSARKLILSADQKSLYYFLKGEDKFSKISLENGELFYTAELAPNASEGWENPATGELWVGGHGTVHRLQTSICRYDAKTGRYLGKFAGGTMPVHFYIDNEEKAVYVISHGSNIVQRFRFSGQLTGEASTGENPFGMDGDKNRLFIANYDSRTVTIYSKEPLQKIGEFPIGDDPLLIRYRGKDEKHE